MALLSILFLSITFAVLVTAKVLESRKKERVSPFANRLPGPKGLPIIGNVHELPSKCSWMKFHEWSVEYGPIYQVNLAGTNHVWIARDKIAHDLLSKRSAIYSDRPFIPALEHDNRTSGQYLPLMSKTLIWSRQRRFAKQIMDKSQKDSFYKYPELESIRLLFELMTDPSKYNHAMESFIARVTSRLAWGTATPAEELKQRARELLIGVSPTGALGNKLPAVMWMPEKLAKAKAWELRRGRTERKFFETMQEEVQQSLMDPTIAPKESWTRMFLQNQQTWGFASALEGAYAVGMHGIAGALTIAAPMQTFCLAICHYPQYQPILHEEIDRVLGNRMPTFDDMPDMPVLRAFIRETLRWRPPVPTGIPHEVTQDDIYEGYHIPKGSVIHPLEWSISRNPDVFPKPDEWNPLRWLEPEFPTYQEPLQKYPTITQYSQFGYGRRTCQGMGVTEADLFVGLGSVAWLFAITANEDTNVPEVQSVADEPEEEQSETVVDQETYFETLPTMTETTADSRRNSGSSLASLTDDDSSSGFLTVNPATRGSLTSFRNDSAISIFDTARKPSTVDEGYSSPGVNRQPGWAASDDAKVVYSSEPAPSVRDDLPEDGESMSELPGRWTFPPEEEAPKPKKRPQVPDYEHDATMNFSTLLIAKPMPFKFDLKIRDQARAETVARAWIEQKVEGEFADSRVYWKGDNQGDAEVGWGETFS